MSKEIIVYLDDYKYAGDGNYSTMYLDFRTADDYNRYMAELGQKEPTVGTYLQIDDYQSPKRLMRGAYYALNMDMIKKLIPEPVQDSFVFAHAYSFQKYEGRNDTSYHLLQTHEPLDSNELYAKSHHRVNHLSDVSWRDYLKFRVNDVSQANWNEVVDGKQVLYVFDIGAPIHAKKTQIQNYLNNYACRYAKDKPVLILSHWDVDHYHCLLQLNEVEIKNNFSKFICPDKMKTCTSQRVYMKMEKALGRNEVHCLSLPGRSSDYPYPMMHQLYMCNGVGLFVGERSLNPNYCGIILYVEGNKGNVIFSGDSLPVQASDVLAISTNGQEFEKEHYLVVPHHGGDFKGKKVYKTYHIPQFLRPIEAIISVDEGNNTYGHPTREMIEHLSSIANWTIYRTDKNGTIIHDLSEDLLKDISDEHERQLMDEYPTI